MTLSIIHLKTLGQGRDLVHNPLWEKGLPLKSAGTWSLCSSFSSLFTCVRVF